jgi:hypothetical protein
MNPQTKISVEGDVPDSNGTSIQLFNRAGGNSNRWALGTGGTWIDSDAFSIGDSNTYRLTINGNGNVGIETIHPEARLHVHGGSVGLITAGVKLSHPLGSKAYQLMPGIPGASETGFSIYDPSGGYDRGNLFVINPDGNIGIGTQYPAAKLHVAGMVRTNVLQITGGSDLSEKFEVANPQGRIKPGMLVAIDPKTPGKLIVSTRAYDRRVAGVISGAGGVEPGMLMGQSGTLADGDHPVALAGRVYVWADTSNGPIAPGDLLTTSSVAGHAMKITDHRKAQGAIIGKAMTELRQGRGLVLTLVSLQ